MIKSFSTTIFKLSITRRLIIDIFEAINVKNSNEEKVCEIIEFILRAIE